MMDSLLAHALHLAGLIAGLLVLTRGRATPVAGSDAGLSPLLGLALVGAMALFLFTVSDPGGLFEDFRDAYLGAGRAVIESPGALAPWLDLGINGFVNLPIVAYLFVPFALLSSKPAMVLFALAGLVCTLGAWRALVRAFRLDPPSAWVLLFLFAASGPLAYSLKEGNISHFLLWPLVSAMVMARRGDDMRAGLLLGAIGLVKLPFLLFGVYYLLRGRWRIALGGFLVCAAASLASVAVFGWDMHLRWYEHCVRPYANDPMSAFNVQSIQSFVLRLQVGAEGLLDWNVVPLAAWAARLSGGLVALLYAMVALAVWRARRSEVAPGAPLHPDDALFMLVMLLACVTSPVSWSHYYTWLLLPAAAFLRTLQTHTGTAAAGRLGWTAVVLGSTAVITIPWSAGMASSLYAATAASVLLFVGLAWMGWLALSLRSATVAQGASAGSLELGSPAVLHTGPVTGY